MTANPFKLLGGEGVRFKREKFRVVLVTEGGAPGTRGESRAV